MKLNEVEFRKTTLGWDDQPYSSACFPTCLCIILRELQTRYPQYSLEMDFKSIVKLCEYDETIGFTIGNTVVNLNEHFRKNKLPFKMIEKSDPKLTIERLDSLVKIGHSFPIMGMACDFLQEQGMIELNHGVDHAVVMVANDLPERIVWFHDPYRPFVQEGNQTNMFRVPI